MFQPILAQLTWRWPKLLNRYSRSLDLKSILFNPKHLSHLPSTIEHCAVLGLAVKPMMYLWSQQQIRLKTLWVNKWTHSLLCLRPRQYFSPEQLLLYIILKSLDHLQGWACFSPYPNSADNPVSEYMDELAHCDAWVNSYRIPFKESENS